MKRQNLSNCLFYIFIFLSVINREAFSLEKVVQEENYVDAKISQDGFTRLMAEIQGGASLEKIEGYIASQADVNAVSSECLRYYNPVLRYALDRGTDPESVAIIKALLKAGANPNEPTYNRVSDQSLYGFMPLVCYAVIYSSLEVLELLIKSGADPHLKIETGLGSKKTALEYAQQLGNKGAKILLGPYSSLPGCQGSYH